MNFKFNLFTFFFLLTCIRVFGQLQPRYPISMPSANASNLAIYGETPVSKFTGMPGIGIPLYTISDGNLSIALGISYHAAGVQPEVHPGWVGSGWSLQSGGVITRKVNGMPDEYPTDIGGFYDNPSILNPADWTSFTNLKHYADNGFDVAPDEFSFNMGGVSGKFVLDNLGNWQVQCDQDVKIVFNRDSDFTLPFMTTPPPNPYGFNTYYRCFGKFTLITPDGTKYIFGGTNDAIDYSTDFFNQNSSNWTATSWYLTKVIAADGIHYINLTYERDQYTNVLYQTIYKNIVDIGLTPPAACHNTSQVDRSTSLIAGNLISPVYLRSIETSKELLQFNRSTSGELRYSQSTYSSSYQTYSKKLNLSGNEQEINRSIAEYSIYNDTTLYKFLPLLRQNGLTSYPATLANLQWKKLDRITLKDKATSQVIKQYDFSYSNSGSQRLTLNSLKESNPSGTAADTIAPYRFYYDQSNSLPGYITTATDDWGYATGSTSTPITEYNFYINRKPNPQFTVAGVLSRIVYPTGGYKLFFFEPNDYSAVVNQDHSTMTSVKNTLGGGLRIKTVFDYDPFTKSLKSKRYFYSKNFTSPNQPNTVSSGIISGLPVYQWVNGTHIIPSGEHLDARLYSRNTLLPMSENADGSAVGYSEVAEVADDNSFTVSKFTNYDDGHFDEPFLSSLFDEKEVLNAFTSTSEERGKLKYSAIYNSAGTRLRSSTISYGALHSNKSYVRATDVRKYQVCDYGIQGAGLRGPFVYEGGAYKIYTYSYIPVASVDSTFDGATPLTSVTILYYDNPANKLNTRIEQTRTDGRKLTTLTSYPQDYASGTAFINNMLSRNLLNMPIEKVNYLTDPVSGAVTILSGVIAIYNTANPFLKDTDNVVESTAPITLANFKFSGTVKGSLPYNSGKLTFVRDPSYKSKASYQYDTHFNLKQVDQTGGISSSILWGSNNSLPIAQISNAKFTEVYYNGFEEDVAGTSSTSKTGLKSKLLNGASFALPAMPALSSGRKYMLSFWYKNTGMDWKYFSTLYSTPPSSISGYTLIDELRINPADSQMGTVAYFSPRGQLVSKTNETAISQRFEYDGLQRLKILRDDNNNILQDYAYSYAPFQTSATVFYFNVIKTGSFQKTGCSPDRTGTSVIYSVPAGSYISTISQADADSQAQNDVNTNGPAFANLNGKCVFYNTPQSGTFYKSNCVSPQQPAPYVVSIPQSTFSSDISQGDADAQAQAEVAARGAFVDDQGTCYIPAANVMVQNGYPAGTPNKAFSVSIKNISTNITYTSGNVNPGSTATFTVPPGTYSAGYGGNGPFTSVQMILNNGLIDCKGVGGSSGNFPNIPVAHSDNLTFRCSSANCPPLP